MIDLSVLDRDKLAETYEWIGYGCLDTFMEWHTKEKGCTTVWGVACDYVDNEIPLQDRCGETPPANLKEMVFMALLGHYNMLREYFGVEKPPVPWGIPLPPEKEWRKWLYPWEDDHINPDETVVAEPINIDDMLGVD